MSEEKRSGSILKIFVTLEKTISASTNISCMKYVSDKNHDSENQTATEHPHSSRTMRVLIAGFKNKTF